MSETVNLPALGESVTEGTVTRWLKEVGDEVAVDGPGGGGHDKVDRDPSPWGSGGDPRQEEETVEVDARWPDRGRLRGRFLDAASDAGQGSPAGRAKAEEPAGDRRPGCDEAGDTDTRTGAVVRAGRSGGRRGSGAGRPRGHLPALGESVPRACHPWWKGGRRGRRGRRDLPRSPRQGRHRDPPPWRQVLGSGQGTRPSRSVPGP